MKKLLLAIALLAPGIALAHPTNCQQRMIQSFKDAKHIYETQTNLEHDQFTNRQLKIWRLDYNSIMKECKGSYIPLPYDRTLEIFDLWDLIWAYIDDEQSDRVEAKFMLAEVCLDNPGICQKYYDKPDVEQMEQLRNLQYNQ